MLRNDLSTLPARPSAHRSKLFLYLFLASLGMFFAASISSYCLIRANAFRDSSREYLPLSLPVSFWISTLFLVGVSLCLHGACFSIRRQKLDRFRFWLYVASGLAIVFCFVQTIGMKQLVEVHFSHLDGSAKSYGICFTLAFLHALHVFGGLVFLIWILFGTFRQRFDHECHWAVDNCASYWHFLDVVWVIMLVTFLVAR